MKTAIDTADELATKYAQCIWWARIPILSRRDPRLKEGKTAPAAWCEVCEEVYAELPNNKSPYISAAEAAPAHIKDAHPAYWDAFIDQAYLAIRAAAIWWARRRNLPASDALQLVENPLDKHWMNIHMPCPIGCGITLHEHFATDQIKDWDKLQFSDEAVDHCVTRLAEHLMRHRRSQIAQLL